jgi:predicted permease
MRWRRQKQRDEDLERELNSHLELEAAEQVENGVSPDEARFAARRVFGNTTFIKEETREMWGWTRLEQFLQDVRYGARLLARSPGFTILALVMLALGIGANTAIFSLIDAILFRSLPVRDPSQLVVLRWSAHERPHPLGTSSFGDCEERDHNASGCSLSLPFFEQVRRETKAFSSVSAFAGPIRLALSGNGPARIVDGEIVSGDYFSTLGVTTIIGRPLQPSDDSPSASPALVLSYAEWQSAFGGERSVLGRVIGLNGIPFTVVGVAEPSFTSLTPGKTQNLWLPLAMAARLKIAWVRDIHRIDDWWLVIVGRLSPGLSLRQAQEAVSLLFRNQVLYGAKPLSKPSDDPKIVLLPAQEALTGRRGYYSKTLYPLLFAAGFVLLIACANMAGLLLARGSARRKEIAVRLALGGGVYRIVRQLITESVVVSAAGAVVGIAFAYWGIHATIALLADSNGTAFPFPVTPDWRILVFTVCITVLTGVLFGAAPAILGTKLELTPVLKQSTSAGISGSEQAGGRMQPGSMLVAAQVALSVLVLVGAGLLVRTLRNLHDVNPGFNTRNVLLFSIDPAQSGYKNADIPNLYRELKSRLAALPGVLSVSYSSGPLLSGGYWSEDVHLEGQPEKSTIEVDMLAVGPDFFRTLGIPLLSGHVFSAKDFVSAVQSSEPGPSAPISPSAPPVPMLVNAAFVRQYFPKQNPLGRRITQRNEEGMMTGSWEIAGVVGDTKYANLVRSIRPMAYVPLTGGGACFELRTALNPSALIPSVRQMMDRLDRNLPLFDVKTQTESIENLLRQQRVLARLAGFFGLLALVLTCIGLYGLLSYEVVRRTREIGIRMALGAEPGDVLRGIEGRGIRVTIVGLAAGIAASLALTRLLSSLLFGVSSYDLPTFAIVGLILMTVALLASYFPSQN